MFAEDSDAILAKRFVAKRFTPGGSFGLPAVCLGSIGRSFAADSAPSVSSGEMDA